MTKNTIDLTIASHLVERTVEICPRNIDAVKLWANNQCPDTFNGHIVLTAPRPSGGVIILIGNFANDGLAAAVGLIPTAEVFRGMVEKGFCISDIVAELNDKLFFVLPKGMYLSACLIELEQEGKLLAVWNGGMPDFIVIDEAKQITHRVSSSKLPLGAKKDIDTQTVFIQVKEGDSGVIYAETDAEIQALWLSAYANEKLEGFLLNDAGDVQAVINEFPQEITVVKFSIGELNHLDEYSSVGQTSKTLEPSSWRVDFDFQASVLRNVEIVPLVINTLMQIQAPEEHRQRIYTILAELCSNALEHGVLRLSSELKKSPNGFAEYYEQRGQRLAELEAGFVKVRLSHEPVGAGGILRINVEDSGDGFDFQPRSNDKSADNSFSGRGVSLLQQLCSNIHYEGLGNSVHVEYQWA